MKKILVICLMFFMCSCDDSADTAVSLYIKSSQNEMNRLNHIQRMTKDTAIINYIVDYKKNSLKGAYEIKGYLESKESFFISLKESKTSLKVYIDSLENK